MFAAVGSIGYLFCFAGALRACLGGVMAHVIGKTCTGLARSHDPSGTIECARIVFLAPRNGSVRTVGRAWATAAILAAGAIFATVGTQG